AGNLLWAWVDTVPGKQEIEAIEVDEEGYVYLAGSHHNGEDWDMLVMKLRQPLFITGKVTDSTGEAMENVPVTISGDTTLDVITDTGGYYGIEFYNGGTYTVSPNLPGWGFTPSSRTYSPLASRMLGQDFTDGRWTGAGEARPPAAFSLDLLEDYVLYSVPSRLHVVVGIYDASGRLLKSVVDGVHEPGAFKAEWKEGIPNGVYFVRLSAGDHTETKKAVLLTR
ncbi:carboxypeptidase regulatory-like domain-containing protein, partial [candidate division WOR-3 bacterium]|nr:carboxypeptidase regulatory-like domain-containing protein [candidate division WOR-3 bacterium]